MSYSDQLKHPRWIATRERLKLEADCICNDCRHQFDIKKLDAHHCWYEHGKEPWDYPDTCFLVLCRPCHQIRQKVQNSAQVVLGMFSRLLTVSELEVLVMELVAKRQDMEHGIKIEL
jgi:hypothetical protein